MARVKQSVLRQRLLQKRGLVEDKAKPLRERYRAKVRVLNPHLKTPKMLLKEIEFNMDIEDILTSGPLHHQTAAVTCKYCIECRFGISYSTASRWRKRLGLPNQPYRPRGSRGGG